MTAPGRVARWIGDKLIARAVRTPYAHLTRDDGTVYMFRYWLVPFVKPSASGPAGIGQVGWNRPIARLLQLAGIAVRVHHIVDADRDPHLHDHPGAFCSVVLRGWYIEKRPFDLPYRDGRRWHDGVERTIPNLRGKWSITFRRATDRHTISLVPEGGAWTLFIILRDGNQWGFYTEAGKVRWAEYQSTNKPTTGRPA